MVKSTSYTQISPMKGRPTIFGNIFEKNVVFLIDTSGSMYHSLEIVKEHLIEVLSSRASSGRDTMFNIITFDENTTKWADRMVPCTPRTVTNASDWIRSVRCGTSTNTMEALLQAYEDDGMDAIYLVTDGLPDQTPAVILHNVHLLHNGRPIHATYITGTHSDQAAIEFLESIARETKGSLHVISLTMLGNIQKVTPVFNERTESIRNYINETDFNVPYSLQTPLIDRPVSAPPLTSLDNPLNYVSVLRAPHGPVPIPYVSRYVYDKQRGHSQVLDYADSVLASRGLAEFVNKSVSSVPVAASIMKGVKVLGRRDADGLYYLATVKGQIQNEKFILDFHKCPAIQKPFVQETPIYECIAMKDSIRHNVCIGDKVLAPWQPDGRYGPGTVIDGIDRRDSHSSGYDDQGRRNLLVTFFNGETTEVGPGIAIRIPLEVFNRLVTELQMPENQRRKMRLVAKTTTPSYDGRSPPPESTWQRKFNPPRKAKDSNEVDDDSALKARIEEQLNRNRHLLDALSMKEKMDKLREKMEKEKALEETEKEVHFIDDDLSEILNDENTYEMATQTFDKYDINSGTQTADFTRYIGRSVPIGMPLSKAGGKPEPKKRWRTWSSGVPPRSSRFRDTLMSKPAEAKQEKPARPGHQEYQTPDGVAFPSATDKKFTYQRWHPHYGFTESRAVDPQLKHYEYRSSKGVPFPQATDRKFATVPSSNWSPDHAGRSTCWEDGLGHGDTKKVQKEQAKLDRKRHVAQQYENRIQKDAMEKEKKESARQQNHREKINQRNQQIAADVKEKERYESEKLQYKKQSSKNVREVDARRKTDAETWKEDRINAMKTRRVQHENMEQSYEKAAQEHSQRRQDGFKQREQKRYQAHHQRLVSERDSEDARERRLKEQEINRQNKLDRIKSDAEHSKEMRMHIKRQNQDKYRASIMP